MKLKAFGHLNTCACIRLICCWCRHIWSSVGIVPISFSSFPLNSLQYWGKNQLIVQTQHFWIIIMHCLIQLILILVLMNLLFSYAYTLFCIYHQDLVVAICHEISIAVVEIYYVKLVIISGWKGIFFFFFFQNMVK